MSRSESAGRPPRWWRAALGVVLAVLAGVLAPAAVVADWAHHQVDDTEAFVTAYGPLVRDPRVQEALTASLTDAINRQLGLEGNRLASALVQRAVGQAAGSDAFEAAWTASLRLAHSELRALLSGDPGRLQVVDGEVQLRFAPFVDAVTQRLTEAGVPFLDRLPEVTGGYTLLRVDPALLPALQAAYRVLGIGAAWLGVLALLAAIGAVAVWPARRRALITVGAAVAVGIVATWWATTAVVRALVDGLSPALSPVAGAVAETALAPLASPALAVAVTGALLATMAALAARTPQS